MRLVFADAAWEDYCHWQTHDAALFARINDLIGAIQRDPYAGILLRPDEVLSGILDAVILEVTDDTLGVLFELHHVRTGSFNPDFPLRLISNDRH